MHGNWPNIGHHQSLITMKKPVKGVNGTMVELTNKLSPKLLILYTIGNKFSLKKFPRFYKLISHRSSLRGISRTANLVYR